MRGSDGAAASTCASGTNISGRDGSRSDQPLVSETTPTISRGGSFITEMRLPSACCDAAVDLLGERLVDDARSAARRRDRVSVNVRPATCRICSSAK